MAPNSKAPSFSNAPAAAVASSATSASRVTKHRSTPTGSRTLRYSSRNMRHLQNTLSDAHSTGNQKTGASQATIASSSTKGKSKMDAAHKLAVVAGDVSMNDSSDLKTRQDTSQSVKPFPIMKLPTEIRLEVYRACLTRPYNILLSKREQPQRTELEESDKDGFVSDGESDDSDDRAVLNPSLSFGSSGASTTLRQANLTGHINSRGTQPRILSGRSSSNSSSRNGNGVQAASSSSGSVHRPASSRLASRSYRAAPQRIHIKSTSEPPRNQSEDPLIVNILQASKEIYKEARSILYSENFFTLDLNTAMSTLACLHQRSRRQIKHVELEIPTYNEILERFQETVRLSLRYCSGLKRLVIAMPFTLPGADGSGTTGNTTVYANGFDILRWLPQECDVLLKGNICVEIETVVNKHLRLAKTLDKVSHSLYR